MTTALVSTSQRAVRLLLVVALLVAALLTTYVVVGAVLGADGPIDLRWPHLVALGAVVLAEEPLRRWLVPGVHELLDQRREPYETIVALSTPAPSTTSAAAAIAHAVGLPFVEVEVDGSVDRVGVPVPGADPVVLSIRYGEEVLGTLRTCARRPGAQLSAADRRLLRDLGGQVALRLIAEQATAQLARARTDLVTAREEERQRIRNDLHDGFAPSLASINLQLKALQRRTAPDPAIEASIELLLQSMQQASSELRRIVYDLRPPLLDDLGLRGALERGAAAVETTRVTVAGTEEHLPAAIEVAFFRIATEAIRNAVRHASASRVAVRISVEDGHALVVVDDDGIGLSADTVAGVGLSSMRQRAEELGGSLTIRAVPGGGTRVAAEIPCGGGHDQGARRR
ncbi:sensor histidine kinase [Nocardioides sp. MH1]|uniref:sensor histidine kinase n=1 Tax=Nocardioides sp. MH1 TaxID=3242490 RepID=UPI0035211426